MTNTPESKAKGEWQVVRQDTNGVRYIEAESLTEEAARLFAERREKQIGVHHQTIWHEKMLRHQPVTLML